MNEKIIALLNEVREEKGESILKDVNMNTTLRGEFGFDSFDLALLTAKLEDEFDVDVFEEGIIDTVGQIVALVEKR